MQCLIKYIVTFSYFLFCFCEINVEEKNIIITGFINYLNGLPNQPFNYDEGFLTNAQHNDNNIYNIEANIWATELHNTDSKKLLQCTATVVVLEDGVVDVPNNNQVCTLVLDAQTETSGSSTDIPVTEYIERGPVHLDNEIQPSDVPSSGEQFIAVPRDQPSPCIGCSVHVDPQATGVAELALLAIHHLDRHQPGVSHALKTVLDVERQVQIVNGVRYILTMTVDYNNCTLDDSENCAYTNTCKISVLEKPWLKLAGGKKYRAILSNNCTEDWLFGVDGEVISNDPFDATDELGTVTPGNKNTEDDTIKAVHNTDLQAQQQQEHIFSDKELKDIQDQIIPYHELSQESSNAKVDEPPQQTVPEIKRVEKLEASLPPWTSSTPNIDSVQPTNTITLSEDNKKLIDDMMNFFDFGVSSSKIEGVRKKRSPNLFFVGGPQVQNINDLRYRSLAKESLQEYLRTSGIKQKHEVVEVKSVTTQVVNGVITRITFTVSPSHCVTNASGTCEVQNSENLFECTSQILEQPWNNIKNIDVNCMAEKKVTENIRHIAGGLKEQDPSSPEYKALAEESLQKYLTTNGFKQHHKVITVEKVSTQVVAGKLTRIDFVIQPTNCQIDNEGKPSAPNCEVQNSADQTKCHSEVWERPWLKEKDVKVNCTFSNISARTKRGILGGLKEQEPNSPEYKVLAEESLQKYLTTNGITQHHKVITVEEVSTQVVAGKLTRIDFVIQPTNCQIDNEGKLSAANCEVQNSADQTKCHSEVWERPWLNEKDVKVNCTLSDISARTKRGIPGGLKEQDPNSPEYKVLAEESLQKYLTTNGITQHHKVITVEEVSTQVVAGKLTRIDFVIQPTNCQIDNEGKLSAANCEVQNSADQTKCHSEVRERPWLNEKDVKVNCTLSDISARTKRGIPGGLKEQDPNSPEYKVLAEESLQKYLTNNGITRHHKVITVEKVSTQVVAGTLTRIDFVIQPTNCQIDNEGKPSAPNCEVQNSADQNKCHSKVWERPWLNEKDVKVNCTFNDISARTKREIPGGLKEQDPNSPEYKILAEESLQKYLTTNCITQHHQVITVEKVSTQVVAGTLTRIDFVIQPTDCQIDNEGKPSAPNCEVQNSADQIKCHSKVWERPWLNEKDVKVNCTFNNISARTKREIPGGLKEQDPNSPEYKVLAEESLQKYLTTNGITQHHKLITVEKVSTQVVAGTLTRIDFVIQPTNCQIDNEGKLSATNCEVQNSADQTKCHSEVWERPWLKEKDVKVNCTLSDISARTKREIPGGLKEQDPNSPEYKALAEESLQKYFTTNGITQHHRVISVERVLTQVVAGTLTKIFFKILPTDCQIDNEGKPTKTDCETQTSANQIECQSDIWERAWLNKTDISVNCTLNVESDTLIPGGEKEEDASSPKYKALAEESLQKYLETNGITQHHKVITVVRVLKQIVAGTLTKIDFVILPTNCHIDTNGKPSGNNCEVQNATDEIACHSEILEKPWLHIKDITVNCALNLESPRSKRQLLGGVKEQNVSSPEYKALAEESLQKYLKNNGITQHHQVMAVERVLTQVVAGTSTKIDFTILPTNCQIGNEDNPSAKVCEVLTSADEIKCHSDVWEQPWLNKKEIKVNCTNSNVSARVKRQIRGGLKEQDPNSPEYKALAEESMQKYLQINSITQHHKVISVERVLTQIVAGTLTKIDFVILPTNCQINNKGKPSASSCEVQTTAEQIKCHSDVWERPWLNEKDITVDCQLDVSKTQGLRNKRSFLGVVNQNPNDPQYQILAEESLRQYLLSTGISRHHIVIQVNQVKEQVIAGNLIVLDFKIKPTTCQLNSEGSPTSTDCEVLNSRDSISCHSKIWKRMWLDKAEISVVCDIDNEKSRNKRFLLTGNKKLDAKSKQLKSLAEESLKKYLKKERITQHYKVVEIDFVEREVRIGAVTKLDFKVSQTNCKVDRHGDPISSQCKILNIADKSRCHSEIWEEPMNTEKNIKVTCKLIKKKYNQSYSRREGSEVIEEVTQPPNENNETTTEANTETTHDDEFLNDRKDINGVDLNPEEKAAYMALAEESLRLYTIRNGISQLLKVVDVLRVITQNDTLSFIKIAFQVQPTNCEVDFNGLPFSRRCELLSYADIFTCYSEIFELRLLKQQETRITCDVETEQDLDVAVYKDLAEESLQIHLQRLGITQQFVVMGIDNVVTEVDPGLLVKIDFTVAPPGCFVPAYGECLVTNPNGIFSCHSEIFQQPWMRMKDVSTSCNIDDYFNQNYNLNPMEYYPVYVNLAAESMQRFLKITGMGKKYKIDSINGVLTVNFEGIIWRIDFTISPVGCENYQNCDISKVLRCISDVWEQEIQDLNINNILDVQCTNSRGITKSINLEKINLDNFKSSTVLAPTLRDIPNLSLNRTNRSLKFKRDDIIELNPKEPESLLLAKNSLQIYEDKDVSNYKKCITRYDVEKVNWITKQEVSPVVYKVSFVASKTTSCPNELGQIVTDSKLLTCFSQKHLGYRVKCWEIDEMEKKQIKKRTKRETVTGYVSSVDVDSEKIRNKAKTALKKYEQRNRPEYGFKIKKIHRAQEQVVAGLITSIEFTISQTKCLVSESRSTIDICDLKEPNIDMRCNAVLKNLPVNAGGSTTTVNCRNVSKNSGNRSRREIGKENMGFTSTIDIHSQKIISKAEIALQKYEKRAMPEYGFKVTKIIRAQEQVVAGLITSIEFSISQTKCLSTESREIINNCDLKEPNEEMRCNAIFKNLVKHLGGSTLTVNCRRTSKNTPRRKRETNNTLEDSVVKGFVDDAMKILEASSTLTHKQKVVQIKNFYSNISKDKDITINFVVGYTNCSKFETVQNTDHCGLLDMPQRDCEAKILEKLWAPNNRHITVKCDDNKDNSDIDPMLLANEGLKRIEAKYPHPRQQKVVKIFSVDKQLTAGLHYRLKIEVGFTNCTALSMETNCELEENAISNRYCRVNVWLEPEFDHPAKFHVTCDGQDENASDLLTEIQAQQLFYQFIAKHSPAYVHDRHEMRRRFGIFKGNLKKIHNLNVYERGTARYAVTRFADLTEDEFRNRFLGLKPSLRMENAVPMRKATIPSIDLPESFDWRSQDAVTEVKDQGSCGSCWAFSVTGNVEGQWKLKTGNLVSLSEQELVDCDQLDKGCDGGLPDNAYRSIEELGGLETETDYPYEGEIDKCSFNRTLARVKISGAVNISSDETEMAQWLVKNGPISIGINANAMQFYVGGISHPWKVLCHPKNLDHGVLIVGYGKKDYPLFNKHLPYWIVKNSWGKSWGEQGYYRVYRGDGTCGVNQMASSAVI